MSKNAQSAPDGHFTAIRKFPNSGTEITAYLEEFHQ
jgi:hypothetical protein